MLIDDLNQKGGLLGRPVEAVVVDPASDWPLFAEKARELIEGEEVDVVFGCWTSVSRKSVLPVFEELNGLLFYPVQYEGEESSKNVFYTGAAPNQQAIPAVEYLMSEDGGGAERFVLLGTDYVYPRTTNKILRAFLNAKGIGDADIMETYTPFGHSDWQTIVADVKEFAAEGKQTAIVSTINGDANVPFYKELANQGSTPRTCRRSRSRSARRSSRASTPRTWSATSPRGTTSCRSTTPENAGVHRQVARLHQGRRPGHQRSDGGALHRLQHVGAGGAPGRHHRRSTPSARRCTARTCRTSPAASR